MLIIGLTGGIASGKTTVADLFAKLGAPIIDADLIARALVTKNQAAYHKIIQHFSTRCLDEQKNINRNYLREIIFNHPAEKLWLENLLHPLIKQTIQSQLTQLKSQNYAYCIVIIPLLIEVSWQDLVDRILVIEADPKLQINRLTHRDQISQSSAINILTQQLDSATRNKYADDIIKNHGDLRQLELAVKNLHKKYLKNY